MPLVTCPAAPYSSFLQGAVSCTSAHGHVLLMPVKIPSETSSSFSLCKEYEAAFSEEDLFTFLFILL